jgi:hypothetical protein
MPHHSTRQHQTCQGWSARSREWVGTRRSLEATHHKQHADPEVAIRLNRIARADGDHRHVWTDGGEEGCGGRGIAAVVGYLEDLGIEVRLAGEDGGLRLDRRRALLPLEETEKEPHHAGRGPGHSAGWRGTDGIG